MGFFVWLYRRNLHVVFGVFMVLVMSWLPALSLPWVLPFLDIVPNLLFYAITFVMGFVWGLFCFRIGSTAWGFSRDDVSYYEILKAIKNDRK